MIGHDGEDNMEVKNRKLSSITAYGKNAKKHDKTQINNVAESIKQYGFVQPIVIDRDGVIVIGHCRALAAKKLGMEEVPCVCVDDLTPEQVNALRLVDNKSNESDWDFDLLADELPGLDLSAFDFDWGLRDELDTSVVEDNYDPVLPAEPKSKLGDVYQLGDHRLMCGDSTSLTDVQKLVEGAQMDLLLTDPPYNVDYQGTAGKIKNDNMEDTALSVSCSTHRQRPLPSASGGTESFLYGKQTTPCWTAFDSRGPASKAESSNFTRAAKMRFENLAFIAGTRTKEKTA